MHDKELVMTVKALVRINMQLATKCDNVVREAVKKWKVVEIREKKLTYAAKTTAIIIMRFPRSFLNS